MSENVQRNIIKRYPVYEPIHETVDRVIAELDTKTGEPELKTGLEVVDRGIFGLHRSQLTTIAARAGQGKTSFACNMALTLSDSNKKVAFVSLEMAKEQIIAKMFCSEMKIDSFRFLVGKITSDEKKKLSIFRETVKEMPLRIIDDYCFTQDELYTLIEHLEFRPEVLIIDHLQHIRAAESKRSERENLTEYLRYLKELAMRYKMAVVCLSQINREGDDKPTLKNLKGTGAIEEMSDHVLILHRQKNNDIFNETNNNNEEVVIDVAKNRFGPTGTFQLLFNGKTGKFMNYERVYSSEDLIKKIK